MSTDCPFCSPRVELIFHEGEHVIGVWDAFPVSDGHALLVTRRHVASWFDATAEERAELAAATMAARRAIQRRFEVKDFNVGVNVGDAAGQTVKHLHVHVIPRRDGDVPDPRGGVRHVIPSKGNYLAAAPAGEPQLDEVERGLISTGEDKPLLPFLVADLARAEQLDVAVAFALSSGIARLYDHLWEFLARKGRLRLLVGDYLDITDPAALRQLIDLERAHPGAPVDLRVFESGGQSFHPKAYIVRRGESGGVAYVGSSNLSKSALEDGIEWNFRVVTARDRAGFSQVSAAFERLFVHPSTKRLDSAWLASYEARRRAGQPAPAIDAVSDAAGEPEATPPEPNPVQREALALLEETRAAGFTAGLVVMATGLGKTWLAAFDSDRPEFKRVLFVAHRDEILSQALRTFRSARPRATFGFYDGAERTQDAEVTFGSIQTLGRRAHLSEFAAAHFDYLVVDEFHHAAAATYRKLIEHFRPKFLLGLTATPERTDGGDLLALCQENLVYRKDLPEGIRLGLLSPFHYFGVPDDVDYQNIPWKSTRFDEEELTSAVATQARAENALSQWRQHGGGRTLGFCVSRRHADFMRDFFGERGVRSAAVHSGETSEPRTESLERLAAGKLDVVFAVDMFNEGVDIPAIETVMMLRPTESQILWLQQLGRGLRKLEGKTLKVIDYIGNHRIFLVKVRTLLQLGEGSDAAIAAALSKVERDEWDLPPGCEVTYELRTVEILRALLRTGGAASVLRDYYMDYRERMGIRPTALEAFHDQYSPRSVHGSLGSWLEFVESMGDMTHEQLAALSACRAQLRWLEKTPMNKSYKMLVLNALLDEGQVPGPGMHIDKVVRSVMAQAARNPRVASDIGEAVKAERDLRQLLIENPIHSWTEGRGTGGTPIFAFEGDVFRCLLDAPPEARAALGDLVREVAEWRLADYLTHRTADRAAGLFSMKVSQASGRPMLFLPDRSKQPEIPQGMQRVIVDGVEYEAEFVKVALNVVRRSKDGENELPGLLRKWFGDSVGQPGTKHEVMAEPLDDGGWRLRPADGERAIPLVRWTSYSREQIPPLFGEAFTPAIWNSGFVVRPSNDPKHVILLATLEPGGAKEDGAYVNKFLGADLFQWMSQNRTAKDGKSGRLIRDHAAAGVAIHLFVRPEKRGQGGATVRFMYCGPVRFESWKGDRPITVRFRLSEPVPVRLSDFLSVP